MASKSKWHQLHSYAQFRDKNSPQMNLNYRTDSKVSFNDIYMYLKILWHTSRNIILYWYILGFVVYILLSHRYFRPPRTYIPSYMIYIGIRNVHKTSVCSCVDGSIVFHIKFARRAQRFSHFIFVGFFITPFTRLFRILTTPIISRMTTSLYTFVPLPLIHKSSISSGLSETTTVIDRWVITYTTGI